VLKRQAAESPAMPPPMTAMSSPIRTRQTPSMVKSEDAASHARAVL